MGYFVIPIAEEAQDIYAFVTLWGKFTYKRLAFGDSEAPDVFQRFMTDMLGEIPGVYVYLDDILIATQDIQQNLKILVQVLKKLQETGVTLNGPKCEFLRKEVDYLGFLVSEEGYKSNPKKIQTILELAEPETITQMRRFISMANFHSRHIPRLSTFLAPLNNALKGKKRGKITWTPELKETFIKAKKIIATTTLLALPDYNKPFEVYTDVSKLAYGRVIMQDGRPISYFSCKFTSAELKYTIIDKELLAVVCILQEYHGMLWGRHIRVYTDHSNLQFEKCFSERILRQKMILEEYRPDIIYIKGRDNVVADALSRLDSVKHTNINVIQEVPGCSISWKELQQAQENIGQVPDSNITEFGDVKLYTQQGRIILPQDYGIVVVQLYHDWLNHPGTSKLYETLKSTFIWQGMFQHISNFTQQCLDCAHAKISNRKEGQIPLCTPDVLPWSTLCVDLIGPYKMNQETNDHYALTMLDPVNYCIEIAPVKSKSSEEIALTLDKWWFCCYPRPRRCLHDQGKEFTG